MQFPWQVAITLIAGCVTLALACLAQTQRKLLVAQPFSIGCLLAACWCFLYGGQMLSDSLDEKLLAMKVGFSLMPFLPLIALEMTYRFVHERKLFQGWLLVAGLVVPILTAGLAWTMNHYPIMRYDFWVDVSGQIPVLRFKKGPWNSILYLYFYSMAFWSFAILIRSLRTATGWAWRARVLFLIARIIPFIFDILFHLEALPPKGMNYAPVSIALSDILFCIILFGDRTGYQAYVARSTLVEKINDLLIVLSGSHRVLDMNRAAAEVLAVRPQAALGQPAEDIFAAWPEVLKTLRDHPEVPSEIQRGGKFYELSISDAEKGGSGSLILWLRDITRRKQAETNLLAAATSAREAEAAKDRYLAMMSHEIRGPLTSVLGFMRLLENTPLNEEQTEYVGHVSRSGDNLLAVINDVLDFSKIEAGQMALATEPFDLRTEVLALCRGIELEARAKSLTLQCHIAPEIPALVVGDKLRVGQILRNLVSNAVKFTTTGGITVNVHRTGDLSHPAECDVRIEVTDTGIGIAPEEIESLFQPFSQATHAIPHQYGGTGLGLTIARRFSELMGGTIFVSSTPQKGSTFTCLLRLGVSDQPMVEKTPEPAQVPQASLNVLIVDDQPVNRRLLQIMLAQLNHRTAMAADGVECLQILQGTNFDVIILDVEMPGLDGFSTARRIRADRRLPVPHIVALTAHASMTIREECLAAGMDDYLSKPFSQRDLKRALANIPVRA